VVFNPNPRSPGGAAESALGGGLLRAGCELAGGYYYTRGTHGVHASANSSPATALNQSVPSILSCGAVMIFIRERSHSSILITIVRTLFVFSFFNPRRFNFNASRRRYARVTTSLSAGYSPPATCSPSSRRRPRTEAIVVLFAAAAAVVSAVTGRGGGCFISSSRR
jgi:hypothetical protein